MYSAYARVGADTFFVLRIIEFMRIWQRIFGLFLKAIAVAIGEEKGRKEMV